MKSIAYVLRITFFICCLHLPLCANEIENFANEKAYISTSDLFISENGISVRINNEIFHTNAVYSDKNGICIKTKSIHWVCPRCHVGNAPWDFVCQWCGLAR